MKCNSNAIKMTQPLGRGFVPASYGSTVQTNYLPDPLWGSKEQCIFNSCKIKVLTAEPKVEGVDLDLIQLLG